MEENIRRGGNNIEKRHYRFYYDSPIQSTNTNIILDVVFEECPYVKLLERNIENRFLNVKQPNIFVKIPTVDCILGCLLYTS